MANAATTTGPGSMWSAPGPMGRSPHPDGSVGAGAGRHQVVVAHDGRHGGVGGHPVDHLRSVDLAIGARDEHHDPVRVPQRFLGPVGDLHGRDGPVRQGVLEVGEEDRTRLGIQPGRGLVEQQYVGVTGERAGEVHPLLLPSGERQRGSIREMPDPQPFKGRMGRARRRARGTLRQRSGSSTLRNTVVPSSAAAG